jgi:hypothetical protein
MRRIAPLAAALLALALTAPAAAPAAQFAPHCDGQDETIAALGPSRAERIMVCIFSQYRIFYDGRSIKRNPRVHTAAAAVLKAKDFSISRIKRELARAGYFSHGGRGFARCRPLAFADDTTASDLAAGVVNTEGFILEPQYTTIGIAFRGRRAFVLTGR